MRTSIMAAIAAGTMVLGAAATAQAADMPVRTREMPVKAIYMPPYSWTGFYAGVNAGYGWMNSDVGSNNGFVGGGQIGYNWQAGNLVYGVETDFQGTGMRGGVGNAAFTGTEKEPYFGTIRGRLGYAFDRSMLYVTGGAAYGKQSFDGTVGGVPFSSSSTYWAGVVGAGFEQALWDRWSTKIEYLHVFKPDNSPLPAGADSGHQDIVRVGLNYHF